MVSQPLNPQRVGFIQNWIEEYYGSPVSLLTDCLGYGKKPAVLVVDLQKDVERSALINRAIVNTAILVSAGRAKGLPIIYTVMSYRSDMKDCIPNKLPGLCQHIQGTEGVQPLDEIRPTSEDLVITKRTNSAFMGTNLLTHLHHYSIDTILIAGSHTSGCIRATATDSYNLGFKTIIPEECVGDAKGDRPHRSNLCDLHIRGADVVMLREVLQYLSSFDQTSMT